MNNYIPYGRQEITSKDIKEVKKVLTSDWLTQGPSVSQFEDKLAKKCGSKYSLAVNSATSALHLSCIALGLKKNQMVWTTPNSFVASANCALYCGAKVDFVDIDKKTWCMSEIFLEEKLIHHRKNRLQMPKIIIPVHLSGQSCNMKKIYELSKEFKFSIIEDASHAVGSNYFDKPVGNCKFSDITVFSFHPVKIITTGEGGSILTNSQKIRNKVLRLRSHGITKDCKQFTNKKMGQWYYEQVELGYNYRMTDISAALGITQIDRLGSYVHVRNKLSKFYEKNFKNSNVLTQLVPKNVYSSRHLFPIRVNKNIREKLFDLLRKNNFGVNLHYYPIHLQPYYKRLGFKKGDFPESERYSDEAISLPLFPKLKKIDQIKIIKIVNDLTK